MSAPGRFASHPLLALAVFLWFGVAPNGVASAQSGSSSNVDPDDPFAGIEEMVVIGSGLLSTFQDNAQSVTAFDSAQIEAGNFKDIRDISAFAPNLEIKSSFAASNPTLFIRGVGLNDINPNSNTAVAIYSDDVYLNSPAGQLGQIFDVENIEVMNGPQSGAYGRNASAGTIHIITRKPTGETNGRLVATYGNFNALEFQGALETVVLPGMLSWRGSFQVNERDGITENRCGGFDTPQAPTACGGRGNQRTIPVGLDEDVNRRSNWAARSLVRLELPDFYEMNWLVNVHGGQNTGDALQFQNVGTRPVYGRSDRTQYQDRDGDPFAGAYNRVGNEELDLFGASLNGTWSVGELDFKSVTAYEWNQRKLDENTDGSPNLNIESILRNTSYQVSQDFRVNGGLFAGEVLWEAGAYFIFEKLRVDNDFSTSPASFFNQTFTQDTYGGAVFTNATWEIFEDVSIEPSIRLNIERKTFELAAARRNRQTSASLGEAGGNEEDLWIAPTGELAIRWRPTEDVTFYAKYSRGWKSGHFNGGAVLERQAVEPVDPEDVDAFEVGFKGAHFDGRISLAGSLFYYDYANLQVFQLENSADAIPVQQLINANDARVYGAELALQASPFEGVVTGWAAVWLEGLSIRGNASWLESEYLDFQDTNFIRVPNPDRTPTPENPRPPASVLVENTTDFSGNRLVSSPRFSASGTVEWSFPLGSGGELGTLAASYTFAWKDDVFFDPTQGVGTDPSLQFPEFALGQDSFILHDLRLAWTNGLGQLSVAGWVRNLTNEEYKLNAFDLAQFFGEVIEVYGDPRTYGVTATFEF